MGNLSPPEAINSPKILIFGGTSEGRELAEMASREGAVTLLSVASDYGSEQVAAVQDLRVLEGRLDVAGMRELICHENPDLIVDATHPHAYEVSRNIRLAVNDTEIRLLRTVREKQWVEDARYFETVESAVEHLISVEGIIFSALGIKSAKILTGVPNFQERVILRVLPDSHGLKTLEEMGYPRKHIIGMQGPFSKDLNKAMFEAVGAQILLSKDSGLQGGFLEKVRAAQELDMQICLLRLPQEDGLSVMEIKNIIKELIHA